MSHLNVEGNLGMCATCMLPYSIQLIFRSEKHVHNSRECLYGTSSPTVDKMLEISLMVL
jgi:hypothetical protein